MIGASTEQSPSAATTGPTAGDVARWDWPELVTRLAVAAGLEVDPERVRAAVRCTSGDDDCAWTDRLLRTCEELGLRAERLTGTVADAAAAVGPEHPVVACTADGDWLVLHDRRGRSLLVDAPGLERPRWMRRGAIAERIDPSSLGAVAWVAVDPPSLFQNVETQEADASDGDDPPAPSPMARLRSLLRQERHDVAVVLVYAIGVGLLTLATPIAVQAVVNTVAFGTLLQPLVVLALLLLAGLAFAAALRALQAWVVEILQRRLFLRLVADLSHRLPRVKLSAFDAAHGPELVNRFFDLFTIQKAASSLLLGGLEIVLTALVGMLVLAFYHPLLLAFDVVLMALVAVILFVLGRGATQSAVKESKTKYEVAGWLEEVARHPVAFKLAGGPHLARTMADQLASDYLGARRKHFKVVFRQLLGALALQAFASAGVLGIGGWLVIERQLTLGQLVAAELIVTAVVASFAKIGRYLETSYDMLAALDKVGQLIDLPLEPAAKTAELPAPSARGTHLAATGITFGFQGREALLRGLDLSVEPGQRVAISGVSGSGRTALVDVLVGLREPGSGRVEVDGMDVRDLHRSALRSRVAVVRGVEIVVGTIADNVTFGRPDVGPAEVREALRQVDLLDEIAQLPDGLRTVITPTGAPLSGGQAERLTLARALAGRPSLLVVDRALDGLDAHTREHVLGAVFSADAPWTLLVITDDPAVTIRCGRTLALEDGRLTEGGD
ncbi:MAG TPA: ATP-binding cassette domain-containing protein [Sandaracinaceae bacterium LLY-WYZ-13_1]|nr:ATP-binding cassette domain-containing protein [Sandaracinaceae bacterium LLY-WYZ-13_1]